MNIFFNFFLLNWDWIFSSLSRWILTFNNQLTSTSTYLITHKKMSIRLNSFLQCFCSNKSRHLPFNPPIPFFHSFLSSSLLLAFFLKFFVNKSLRSNSKDMYILRNTYNIEKNFEFSYRILKAGFLILHIHFIH